jgi:hypothetical protein
MIGAELVRTAVEVSCELSDRTQIGTQGSVRVVSTLEFFEHQLSKIGHRDLLVTAQYRDSEGAADDDQCRRIPTRSVCRQASFKSAFLIVVG